VPWIPIDATAKIIVDLVLSDIQQCSSSATAPWLRPYSLVNPNSGSWSSLVPTISKHLSAGSNIVTTTVIFEEWLEALQETTPRTGDVMQNPGVKLLDFSASMN